MSDATARRRRTLARGLYTLGLAFCVLVASISPALAAPPSVPGHDALWPAPDQDLDGYTTDGSKEGYDCDDTNERVFPGITYVSGGNFVTCNSGGSITVNGSTASLANLPTGTNTYFVDCDSGSGTTCSSGSPCGTIAQATSGGSPGSPPASSKTLVAGDRVWYRGTCSTTYSDGTRNVIAEITPNGTSGSPIIIHAIPGVTAKILLDGASENGLFISGDYVHVRAGEYTGSASPLGPMIWNDHTLGGKVEGGYFHDLIGNGDNNFAPIYNGTPSNGVFSRNLISDISLSTGNADGKYGIISFFDDGDTFVASKFEYNKFFTTRASRGTCTSADDSGGALKCFTAIRFKHGTTAAATTGTHSVKGNIAIWSDTPFWVLGGSSINYERNLIYGPSSGHAFVIKEDASTNSAVQSITITDNTIVDGPLLQYEPDDYSTTPYNNVTTSGNVTIDDTATYSAGGGRDAGIYRIQAGGSDAQMALMLSQSMFSSNSNCYWNSTLDAAGAPRYGWFQQTGTGANGGGMYSFTNWKSNVTSQDTSSFEEDPNGGTAGTLDSYYRATASNCANKGWLRTSEEVAAAATASSGSARTALFRKAQ